MGTVVAILDRDSWSANTDNIVIADAFTKSLTWVPRDLWCPSLHDRVNKAFPSGGVEGLLSALRELGFQCDHGLVLRRGATEQAAAHISVEIPVSEELDFWYPLEPTRRLEDGQKIISFRPPAERLEGERIHQWVGARKGLGPHTSDRHRMVRQQIFLRALLEQGFDFKAVVANKDLVRMSTEEALTELACINSSWRMQTFRHVRPETIDGKMVLVKRGEELRASNSQSPQLAVVVLALRAPSETVDAVRSLLDQRPRVEVVVVNSGGGGMAQLLARHGLNVPVIERQESLYVGAVRNIGIKATGAPYVAFLAADCLATPNWARRRIKAHQAGAAAVGSAVANSNPHNPFAWAAQFVTWPRRMPGARKGLAYGASYDRRLFEDHGFFREDLRTGEDGEFHDRLPQGQKPIWNSAIVTLHRNPTGFLHLISDQFQRGYRMARVYDELQGKPFACGFARWRSRTRDAVRASRRNLKKKHRTNLKKKHRTIVLLAVPIIPIAAAAYCIGARYWQLRRKAKIDVLEHQLCDERSGGTNMTAGQILACKTVLTKQLFRSPLSPVRLLRDRPESLSNFLIQV